MSIKPRPWYETYPRKYWTAAERAAALKEGWKPSAAESMYEHRQSQQLPVQPMIFGAAVERPEHKKQRERRLRLVKLMAKHSLDDKHRPLGWRI